MTHKNRHHLTAGTYVSNWGAIFAGVSTTLPTLAFASDPPTDLKSLINLVIGIINLLIPLIFTVVFVYLVWKLIETWILNPGDEQKRTEGKSYAIAAVIAIVLAVSTWGIIALLRQSLFGV